MRFTWDSKKAQINIKKHGIRFEDACSVFADHYALTIFDAEHSVQEDRWISLGQTRHGIIIVLIHTYRDAHGVEYVRIISARKATKHEESQYFTRRV